ncbi:hypothetical protein [Gloeobacter morelensis]|uniref:hypothetical protein n=1 Tax=Gloeobacter morelensis TaxID=2907343 RepID=UPI001E566397|nr:hypothetical protein [Gloeobacter morelensis]UFP97214.1 hypothetical protein ISF26_24135 [Gloeobacter morelensis MG652769]
MVRDPRNREIRALLNNDVRLFIWALVRRRPEAHHFLALDLAEREQCFQMAAWLVLAKGSDHKAAECPAQVGFAVYTKMMDLLRNRGKSRLGLGLRAKSNSFEKGLVRGLSLEYLGEFPAVENLSDNRLEINEAREWLVSELTALGNTERGAALVQKIFATREERMLTLMRRSRSTLVPLLKAAAEQTGCARLAVRVFYEAVEHLRSRGRSKFDRAA